MREQHRQAGDQVQQVAEGARDDAILTKADPDEAGTFERPRTGRAARVDPMVALRYE